MALASHASPSIIVMGIAMLSNNLHFQSIDEAARILGQKGVICPLAI